MVERTTNLIRLASMKDCTACAACVSVCPTNCITMREDREGFLQPYIDTKTCISCHKCEKVCPILNPIQISTDFETQAFAVINNDDEVRVQSSSGGVFFLLAKWVIEQGGVVFGARWNEKWEVVHDCAEDIEGVKAFMKSKYVQSAVGDTLRQAKQFLENGRWVLYSGTPCQLGGLRAYLGKEYDRLIQVDLVCHGVPSPGVWRSYLNDYYRNEQIVDVTFRDKQDGWMSFQCVTTTTTSVVRQSQMGNPYFRGFLQNIYLRKSCYDCRFKQVKRKTDITLADYWGVHLYCTEMHDDKGTSLVFIHTDKGKQLLSHLFENSAIKVKEQDLITSISWNSAMQKSVPFTPRRNYFFNSFSKGRKFSYLVKYIDKDKFFVRVVRKLKRILKL